MSLRFCSRPCGLAGKKILWQRDLALYFRQAKLLSVCPVPFESQKGAAFSVNTMFKFLFRIYVGSYIADTTSKSRRRTFITNLVAKDIVVRVLAELAGHPGIAIVERYIDANDDQLRAAVELT